MCADKAYGSEDHRKWRLGNGIVDRLMYKAQKNKPLTNWQVWFNKSVAVVRQELSVYSVSANGPTVLAELVIAESSGCVGISS